MKITEKIEMLKPHLKERVYDLLIKEIDNCQDMELEEYMVYVVNKHQIFSVFKKSRMLIDLAYDCLKQNPDFKICKKHFKRECKKFFEACAQYLINGDKVIFPQGKASMDIRKKVDDVKKDLGGRYILARPDWHKTRQLWEKDPEARLKYKRIFYLSNNGLGNTSYKLRYYFHKLKYKNMYFISATPMRKKIKEAVENGTKYPLYNRLVIM